jgi:glycosyltransferase involved in cell wall biosynthesis
MKVLVLTKYDYLGASSRYRVYQFINHLENYGINFTIAPLLDNKYLVGKYSKDKKGLISILKAYSNRIKWLFQSSVFDLIWIQKELLPWIPSWLEEVLLKYSKVPYIIDFDDAEFHKYDSHKNPIIKKLYGDKIDKLMRNASTVIVGNKYLQERAYRAGAKDVVKIPTVIDIEKYPRKKVEIQNERFTIGWIGSPSTQKYLKEIEIPLQVLSSEQNISVTVIGSHDLKLHGVNYNEVKWTEDTYIQELMKIDVGIMPLPDTPWERGKCGFKLLQYMGCYKPVIASPVGVNKEIVIEGVNGFLARDSHDWIEYITKLKNNANMARVMGENGRKIVEEKYNVKVVVPQLAKIILSYSN